MGSPEAIEPLTRADYWILLVVLLFARGMDLLSTWVATPGLVLEANPVARRLGWRHGVWVNMVVCLFLAAWDLPAIVVATTSVLVAARNFQSAWLMRVLGESGYRMWMAEKLSQSKLGLYLFCLGAQAFLTSAVGGVLAYSSADNMVALGIGVGIVAYAVTVLGYTLLAVRKLWMVEA